MHQPFFARSSHSRPLRVRCDAIFRFSSGLFFYFSLASTFRAVHINFSFRPLTLTLSNLWTLAIADAMLSAQHQKLFFLSLKKLFPRLMHSSCRCEQKLLSRVDVERLESRLSTALLSHSTSSSVCGKKPLIPSSERLLYPLSSSHFPLKSGEQKKKKATSEMKNERFRIKT